MNRLAGLKPVAITLVLLAFVLAGMFGLVQAGQGDMLVPSPQQAAESFYRGLMAHNFDAARSQLSQSLAENVSADDLQARAQQLEQTPARGIDEAEGEVAQIQGDSAQATVKIRLKNNAQENVTVQLTREQGQWKVASLPPIETLGP